MVRIITEHTVLITRRRFLALHLHWVVSLVCYNRYHSVLKKIVTVSDLCAEK